MARETSWRQLSIGILGVCAVLAAALATLVFARVGMLHGKKFTFYVTTDAASGVVRGTEVWLDGQKVGQVRGVSFRPPSSGRNERVVLTLDVLESARSQIRLDTRAQVEAGLSVIGDRVLSLTSGTTKQPAIGHGDTLRIGAQLDLETMTAGAQEAMHEFPGIFENVKLLAAQLHTAEGTLGALGALLNQQPFAGDTGRINVASLRARSARLIALLSDSNGTVGKALGARRAGSLDLRARATQAMAQADSIRALLASNQHSLGRFRRDSTLVRDIAQVRNEMAHVQRLAAEPNGTIGRLMADSALARGVARDLAGLDSVLADIKKHPFRYLVF